MLVAPTEIKTGYAEFLTQKNIAQKYTHKCQKYLRYYLDFCHKYNHRSGTISGVEGFLAKLHEKKQSVTIQKEAQRAGQLYHEYLTVTKDVKHYSA